MALKFVTKTKSVLIKIETFKKCGLKCKKRFEKTKKQEVSHLHKNNSSNFTHCGQDFLCLLPVPFKSVYCIVKNIYNFWTNSEKAFKKVKSTV